MQRGFGRASYCQGWQRRNSRIYNVPLRNRLFRVQRLQWKNSRSVHQRAKFHSLDQAKFEALTRPLLRKNDFFNILLLLWRSSKQTQPLMDTFGKKLLSNLLISQYLYNCIFLLNNTWGGRGCTQIITWVMIYQDHKASTIS